MSRPGLFLLENDSESEQQTKLLFKILITIEKE